MKRLLCARPYYACVGPSFPRLEEDRLEFFRVRVLSQQRLFCSVRARGLSEEQLAFLGVPRRVSLQDSGGAK